MSARRLASLVAVVLLAGPAGSAAQSADGPETTAFPFLTLGTSPRIEALAGAGTAIAEGADALHWNPALLSRTGRRQVSATYFNWLDGVHSGYLGGVQPWGRAGLGIGVRTLRVSSFHGFDGHRIHAPRGGVIRIVIHIARNHQQCLVDVRLDSLRQLLGELLAQLQVRIADGDADDL